MSHRIPCEAFAHYLGLGPDRSYRSVADHFGVSKQAIVKAAHREAWQLRIGRIEEEARARNDREAVEAVSAMNERHLRTLEVVQRKALEGLRRHDVKSASDAVRALDMAIAKERTIRGEPSESTSIEHVTRREMQRWLVRTEEEGDAGDEQ